MWFYSSIRTIRSRRNTNRKSYLVSQTQLLGRQHADSMTENAPEIAFGSYWVLHSTRYGYAAIAGIRVLSCAYVLCSQVSPSKPGAQRHSYRCMSARQRPPWRQTGGWTEHGWTQLSTLLPPTASSISFRSRPLIVTCRPRWRSVSTRATLC